MQDPVERTRGRTQTHTHFHTHTHTQSHTHAHTHTRTNASHLSRFHRGDLALRRELHAHHPQFGVCNLRAPVVVYVGVRAVAAATLLEEPGNDV